MSHRIFYQDCLMPLRQANIDIFVKKTAVKNINFRIKQDGVYISSPSFVSDKTIALAILTKQKWIITHFKKLQQKSTTHPTLWGVPYDFGNKDVLDIYRLSLHQKIPSLQDKWQAIVKQNVTDVRVKKMHTRWGTCNTKARRIWLSAYLPAYPYECTEYVFVHELCHLHHANHSQAFWACLQKAMPDYQIWHNMLKGVCHQNL